MTHWLLPASLLLVLLPAAAADPPLAPPMDLHAEGTGDSAVLAWDAPLGAGEGTVYRVYADGALVASVQATRFSVPLGAPTLYAVTAVAAAGGESLPASAVVGKVFLAPDPGAMCPPLGTAVYTYWPFVQVETYPECLPLQPHL